MLWGHILPYTKDGLVQPKHIRRAELARRRQFLVKVSGIDDSKPCQFECEGTEGFKQVYALAW